MRARWGDLVARSRGMSTHLLHRTELATLARAPDLSALASDLARLGFPLEEPERSSPAALELAARRKAAAGLRLLARWAGPRCDTLSVVFEDEDRRSLRGILRGIAQHAAPEARLAGLLPSPALPERALRELSRQPSPAAVAALLVLWKSPYGPPLRAETARAEPDLLGVELCVNRTFAERALRGARRAGRELLGYVREAVDLENAFAALVLAGEPEPGRAAEVFLPGGGAVTLPRFEAAVRTGSPELGARSLSSAFAGSPLCGVFERAALGDIERMVLSTRIAEMRRHRLRDPLGPAEVLLYALRLRAEVLDLQHIIWGIALAVPAPTLEQRMVVA